MMPEVLCISTFFSSISINKDILRPGNTTNCNATGINLEDELSTQTKIILGTAYIAAFILGTFGNLLAVFTVLLNKRVQTTGNLLLLNLSISDLIVTMICMPVVFGYQVLDYPNWPHSKATCIAYKYLVQLSVFCSFLTLLTISIHRYFVLQSPLTASLYCIKKRHIFVIYWVCALLFTIPTCMATQLVYISDGATVKLLCIEVYESKTQELVYLSLRVSTYFLTVLTSAVLHTWIAVKIWKNRQIDVDPSKITEIKMVVRLLLAATIVFSVCWLPYALHVILAMSRPQGYQLKQGFDLFGNFLGLANSALDPYIYCYYSKTFRTGFKDILQSIRGYLSVCRPRTIQPDNLEIDQIK